MSDIKANKKNNRTLIAIIVVSVLPIAAAYFMFFTGIGVPEHTVNAGRLLGNPVSLSSLLEEDNAEFLQHIQQDKKWRLLIPISDECNEACELNLYTTRQVHIRLAQKSVRVERVAVNIGGTVGLRIYNEIKAEHPKLKFINLDAESWQEWLSQSETALSAEQEHFYLLVDQEGNAMMAYHSDVQGNDLLKDLKRALKYSIDFQK
ncbi:hypothetical protein SAMN02745866_03560 [Alteromonadaceae bacterium Bs31]|nr:hypothetical protein SAMN02745866_03560 [Alteromonadaceae bacterium Bs31]